MTTPSIQITQTDYDKLNALVQELTPSQGKRPEHLQVLLEELARAEKKNAPDISPDVVTLNSRVRLKEKGTGDIMEFTLVYPDEADIDSGKLSVLAPLGTAMLGHRVGDVFGWQTPQGKNEAKIEEILFQPEEGYRNDA